MICAYAPRSGYAVSLRSDLFRDLLNIYSGISINGVKLTFGYFNARIHHRLAGEQLTLRPYIFGYLSVSFGIRKIRIFV